MASSIYSRAVQRAIELLGTLERLSKALQVPGSEIEKWLVDQAKPPREIFLRIVDVILDETSAGEAGDPPDTPPARDAAPPSERYRE